MNAIYARQSVDRADSISIESQIEFCQYEMRGEQYKVYTDRGYSGKNTDRPAFAEMMNDIESGVIGKVVVYKLDRISRSILDFSNMMEQFGTHKVEFVSTTEKFDTSSPMGRAMLNICIVFAQLERETIQKRVADAYYSRSQKSFYMGGRVPYGFRLIPTTIDGVKTSMYEINAEEAEQVRLIYELYSKPECSYGDIIRYFQAHGILKNGKPWGRTRLADVLRNPIYVRSDLSIYEFYRDQGAIIANDPGDFIGTNGCYYYKGKDSTGRKQMNLEGNHLVLAPHEGIVPADLWLKCRAKCLEAQQIKPYQKAKNTWHIRKCFTEDEEATKDNGWVPVYFENHDLPRCTNYFFPQGTDTKLAAKFIATILLTMRGTPFIYEGQELGMTNIKWPSIKMYNDISSIGQYELALKDKLTPKEAMKGVWKYSRDNARSPMTWNSGSKAGFTTGRPWLPLNDEYPKLNVETETEDENSVLNYYKNLIKLRKQYPALIEGDYEELLSYSPGIYAYARTTKDITERILVIDNTTAKIRGYKIPELKGATLLASTYGNREATLLRSYEVRVYKVKK